MFRLRCFKRFKTTSFIALAVLLICAVGAYTVHATTVSGSKSKVYYEFSLDELEADAGWAYSYHYFYIINNRHGSITVDWESSHKILSRGSNDPNLPDDTVFGSVTIDGLGKPNGDVRFRRRDTRMTYYGYLNNLSNYYLEAYTRINIHGLKIPKDKITKTLDLPTE